MDKAKIIQGRGIINEFYRQHETLHAKPWTSDVPDQHTSLNDDMLTGLNRLGYSDVSQLDVEEETERFLSLQLPPFKALRFIDVSNLSMPEWIALHEVLPKLRADDKIEDTLIFHYIEGGNTVAIVGNNDNEAKHYREVCMQNNIPYVRNLSSPRGTMNHDDVNCKIISKDRFFDMLDIWDAMVSVIVKTLWALGINVVVKPGGNNISIGGLKIAQGSKKIYKDVQMAFTHTFRDFDYNLGALAFEEPDIRSRVTTIKEVLGRDIPLAEFKAAYLVSLNHTFSTVSEESLNAEELSLLDYLRPKYTSREWNEFGQTDRVLVETSEITDARRFSRR